MALTGPTERGVDLGLMREMADAIDRDRGHDKSLLTRLMRDAADEIRALRREREPGRMPNECHNPECGTIRYGTGYTSCPSCGSPPAGPEEDS